jgi:hypothetical protein
MRHTRPPLTRSELMPNDDPNHAHTYLVGQLHTRLVEDAEEFQAVGRLTKLCFWWCWRWLALAGVGWLGWAHWSYLWWRRLLIAMSLVALSSESYHGVDPLDLFLQELLL